MKRLTDFSTYLPKAVVASEDSRFYWHLGVDPIGILRAVLVNIQGKGFQQGASTDDVVKGALCCSGMYDLKPVRLSKRSEYVAFTDEVEEKLSSQRRLDRLNCPVVVAYGTFETPEFQRQNREFAAAVKSAGKPVTLLIAEGYNHFEIAEAIGNPLSLLGSAVLEQMKLA